jgi:hypothetical protein
MSRHFKISSELSDSDMAAFQRRRRRGQTIDQLWEWLKQKGISISRTAVGNFCHANHATSAWPLRMRLGITGDASARSHIAQSAATLKGEDLATLAEFASFLSARRLVAHSKKKNRSEGHSRRRVVATGAKQLERIRSWPKLKPLVHLNRDSLSARKT